MGPLRWMHSDCKRSLYAFTVNATISVTTHYARWRALYSLRWSRSIASGSLSMLRNPPLPGRSPFFQKDPIVASHVMVSQQSQPQSSFFQFPSQGVFPCNLNGPRPLGFGAGAFVRRFHSPMPIARPSLGCYLNCQADCPTSRGATPSLNTG